MPQIIKIRIEAQGPTIPARAQTQRERVGRGDHGASRAGRSVREFIAIATSQPTANGPAQVVGATFSPVGIARNGCGGRAVLRQAGNQIATAVIAIPTSSS